MIHKRSTAFERSVKNILLEDLNKFHSANLKSVKFIKVNQILMLNTLRDFVLKFYASVALSVISEYITNRNHGR